MKKIFVTVFAVFNAVLGYTQVDSLRNKIDSNQTLISNSIEKINLDLIKREDKIEILNNNLKLLNDELKRLEGKKNLTSKERTRNNFKIAEQKKTIRNSLLEIEFLKGVIAKSISDTILLSNTKKLLETQKNDLKEAYDALIDSNKKAQIDLKTTLEKISQLEDSLESIAIISLIDNSKFYRLKLIDFEKSKDLNEIFIKYKNEDSESKKITESILKTNFPGFENPLKINRVHLFVKEGRIVEIIVNTDEGIFRNTECQIDLVHFSERRFVDKLFLDNQNPNNEIRTFILVGDVIKYEPVKSFGDVPYSEFEVTLTPNDKKYIIRESTSINSYFELAAFTDIKGVSGGANGLAQISGSAKFITSTRNYGGTSFMINQFISFNGGISKFDNDFKGTFISKSDTVSRKDLFQRSLYSVGLKANIFRFVKSPYPKLLLQDLQFNIGFNFLGSRLADTLSKLNDTLLRTVTQNQIYFEPIMSISRQKNFSLTLALPLFYQNVKADANIANSDWEWWICPSINLMYYAKKDFKSKLFFRYNHFSNLRDSKESFNQLQLGFSTSLSNVMQGG